MKRETTGTKNDRKGGIRTVFVLAKYQLELGVPEQGGISANPRSTSRAFGKYAHLCHTRMSVLIALMPGFGPPAVG